MELFFEDFDIEFTNNNSDKFIKQLEEEKILIKISYLGSSYKGLCYQVDQENTIEGHFFNAAIKTKLIIDRNSCQFSRCGRTDKGVHASGNYFSLKIQSRPLPTTTDGLLDTEKICVKLNSCLPNDIRVLEAKVVPKWFDARFDCLYRIYKYFFICQSFNFEQMKEASKLFIGDHDFTNFCKVDNRSPRNPRRRILSISLEKINPHIGVFTITGLSFLWHQIRYMVASLFEIGLGKSNKSLITDLLLKNSSKSKRDLNIAPADGLVLYNCIFEGIHFDNKELQNNMTFTFQNFLLKNFLFSQVLNTLSGTTSFPINFIFPINSTSNEHIEDSNKSKFFEDKKNNSFKESFSLDQKFQNGNSSEEHYINNNVQVGDHSSNSINLSYTQNYGDHLTT